MFTMFTRFRQERNNKNKNKIFLPLRRWHSLGCWTVVPPLFGHVSCDALVSFLLFFSGGIRLVLGLWVPP